MIIKEEEIIETSLSAIEAIREFDSNKTNKSIPGGFLFPLFEKENIEIGDRFKNSKVVFVIGIGGSNLATKAIYKALKNELLPEESDQKILFLESPEESDYKEIEKDLERYAKSKEDICIIVTSKSGNTLETLDCFENMYRILENKFGDLGDRVIIISSKEGSKIWNIGESINATLIEWTGSIGGRFSAFTKAHTLPLSIANIDIEKFLNGAKEKVAQYVKENPQYNTALKIASEIYLYYENGIEILDLFVFDTRLENIGKWSRQLVAESLGKENISLEKVGITPTVSVGPRDLHSMLELYIGGPKNRYTIFIKNNSEPEDGVIDKSLLSTIETYKKEGLPFFVYEIENINEKSLGEFMIFMMIMVVYLGYFMKVDPYNQEAVETYKKILRSI